MISCHTFHALKIVRSVNKDVNFSFILQYIRDIETVCHSFKKSHEFGKNLRGAKARMMKKYIPNDN